MEKEFLKRFREEFAIKVANISEKSAYSYVTYLRNACKLPDMENKITLIAGTDDSALKIKYAEELCEAIDLAYHDSNCVLSKNDLNNSYSAVQMLLAYVYGLQWVKSKGGQAMPVRIFNKKEIIRVFKSRLRTQDRIYDYGAFPTDLLSKLATKYKISGFWDELISKTKFIYDKRGNSDILEDIDYIIFGNNRRAYYEKNGKTYVVLTKDAKTSIYKELKLSTYKDLRDLSLDHDAPLECELKKALDSVDMPEYEKLCKDILIFKQSYISNNPGARCPEIISEYEKIYDSVRLQIDEEELLREIQRFIKTLSLTIMDRRQNSSKNNHLIP